MSSAAAENPETVNFRNELLLASKCYQQHESEEAIRVLYSIIDRDPLNVEALTLRGEILKSLGIYDLAAADMQTINEIKQHGYFSNNFDEVRALLTPQRNP